MTRLYARWTAINNDRVLLNFEFFQGNPKVYNIGFVFGHARIHIKYADYLICVHGARSSRTTALGNDFPVSSKLI